MAKVLYIDATNNRLVQGLESLNAVSNIGLVKGDAYNFRLYFLTATGEAGRPYDVVDHSSSSVAMSIGRKSGTMTSGNYYISFGGETANIPFSATPVAALQNGLNALTSISSAGGVSVNGSNGTFVVKFNTAGAQSAFVVDPAYIRPCMESYIVERNTGSVTATNEQIVQFLPKPNIKQTAWNNVAVAATAFTTTIVTGSDDVSLVQEITIANASGGHFQLTIPAQSQSIISSGTGDFSSGYLIADKKLSLYNGQVVTITGFSSYSGVTAGVEYIAKDISTDRKRVYLFDKISNTAISFAVGVTAGSVIEGAARYSLPIFNVPDATEMRDAINSIAGLASNFTTEDSQGKFRLTLTGDLANTNIGPIAITNNLLVGYNIKQSVVTLMSDCLTENLDGNESLNNVLEIEINDGTSNVTPIQVPCTISQEIDR